MDQRIIDQFNAKAPFKLADATLVVLALIGSHSHNTYVSPTDPQAIDDIDYMGIVIPPITYTFGLEEWDGLNFQFEELDCVFYSFKKFVSLLVKSNPNVLGLLWLKPEHYVITSDEWETLVTFRSLFSTKRAYDSFVGYAHGQMKKMTSFDLDTQSKWDESVKLITAAGWTVDNITQKAKSSPMPDYDAVAIAWKTQGGEIYGERNLALDAVLSAATHHIIKIHAKHFQGYMGEKRKALVRKYGYDTKNAAHLIRLMSMCIEFLETGVMNVFRTHDADYIRDIKMGKYSLEDVKQRAESLFVDAENAYDISPLPDAPNSDVINNLVVDIYLTAYML